jgi:glycosyltransferase involved in cell wall biosynthesis
VAVEAFGARPKMHLAIYTAARTRGGAEMVTGNLIESVRPDIAVTVVGTDPGVIAWLASRRRGTATVRVEPIARRYQLHRMLAFRRAIRRLRAHVLHVVVPWSYDVRWEIAVATTVRSMAVIGVEHSWYADRATKIRRLVKRLGSRRSAAHVAVGERVARQVEEVVALPPGSVRTIHNGVPIGPVHTTEPKHTGSVVGTMARLDPVKGLDVLLRALADLPDATLVIAGDGPEGPALRDLAEELGVGTRVRFEGWSDDPEASLARYDVFALPSRSEGLPLSVCEAMVAGLPVVASDVGSVREIVDDGVTGLLVPAGDVPALTSALRGLLADAATRRAMGERGRQRVAEGFSVKSMTQAYESLYDEVTRDARGPRRSLRARRSS